MIGVTVKLHKQRYVYYRCSYGRGKVRPSVYARPEHLRKAGRHSQGNLSNASLFCELAWTRCTKIDSTPKSTKILVPKNAEFREQEINLASEIANLRHPASSSERALLAKKILELAHKEYFLYLTPNPAEHGHLLKMVILNWRNGWRSLTPTYRKPFDMIFQRARNEELVGARGFEPRTPCAQGRCATRLRYAPT